MEEMKLSYLRYSNHNFQNNKQEYDELSEMTPYNQMSEYVAWSWWIFMGRVKKVSTYWNTCIWIMALRILMPSIKCCLLPVLAQDGTCHGSSSPLSTTTLIYHNGSFFCILSLSWSFITAIEKVYNPTTKKSHSWYGIILMNITHLHNPSNWTNWTI